MKRSNSSNLRAYCFILRRLRVITLALVSCLSIIQASEQSAVRPQECLMNLTDKQVAKLIGSRDEQVSYKAAKEVMRRGERMIFLLLENKGNRNRYAWGTLGRGGDFTLLSTDDKEYEEGRVVTVDVASLYLIMALYHGDIDFAQTAYLKGGSVVEDGRYNSQERVQKAWASVEKWIERYKKEGLASLRSLKHDPLADSGLRF